MNHPFGADIETVRKLVAGNLDWPAWERLIRRHGYRLDRPRGAHHPRFPEITYPIDYGYVHGTRGTDGEEIDVFVGTAATGLVGALITDDYRRGDREIKFLFNVRPEEVYLVIGFLNFAPDKMQGRVILRRTMDELWTNTRP